MSLTPVEERKDSPPQVLDHNTVAVATADALSIVSSMTVPNLLVQKVLKSPLPLAVKVAATAGPVVGALALNTVKDNAQELLHARRTPDANDIKHNSVTGGGFVASAVLNKYVQPVAAAVSGKLAVPATVLTSFAAAGTAAAIREDSAAHPDPRLATQFAPPPDMAEKTGKAVVNQLPRAVGTKIATAAGTALPPIVGASLVAASYVASNSAPAPRRNSDREHGTRQMSVDTPRSTSVSG